MSTGTNNSQNAPAGGLLGWLRAHRDVLIVATVAGLIATIVGGMVLRATQGSGAESIGEASTTSATSGQADEASTIEGLEQSTHATEAEGVWGEMWTEGEILVVWAQTDEREITRTQAFLNVDNDTSTGLTRRGGADFLLEGDRLLRWDTTACEDSDWCWDLVASVTHATPDSDDAEHSGTWTLSIELLGDCPLIVSMQAGVNVLIDGTPKGRNSGSSQAAVIC